jgi:hypothetical protein
LQDRCGRGGTGILHHLEAEIAMSIKDMVKDGKKVRFACFRGRDLWYRTECSFEFPVPIDDAGDAVFLAEDKAMLFMRYIRKHTQAIAAARIEQHGGVPG